MTIDKFKLNKMTDTQIASAIATGEIEIASTADWAYICLVHPQAFKIYAVVLSTLAS